LRCLKLQTLFNRLASDPNRAHIKTRTTPPGPIARRSSCSQAREGYGANDYRSDHGCGDEHAFHFFSSHLIAPINGVVLTVLYTPSFTDGVSPCQALIPTFALEFEFTLGLAHGENEIARRRRQRRISEEIYGPPRASSTASLSAQKKLASFVRVTTGIIGETDRLPLKKFETALWIL
jgi:hypothetical protein